MLVFSPAPMYRHTNIAMESILISLYEVLYTHDSVFGLSEWIKKLFYLDSRHARCSRIYKIQCDCHIQRFRIRKALQAVVWTVSLYFVSAVHIFNIQYTVYTCFSSFLSIVLCSVCGSYSLHFQNMRASNTVCG